MQKRVVLLSLYFFILIIFIISYFSYSFLCQSAISGLKNQIVIGDKHWEAYISNLNKISLKELNNFTTSPDLKELLLKLNQSTQIENNALAKDAALSSISSYISSFKNLSPNDAIVVYGEDGLTKACKDKVSFLLTKLPLTTSVENALTGEKAIFLANVNGNLYLLNIAPVLPIKQAPGVVLYGKKLDNTIASYVKDLSDVNIIVFSKDKIIASSLPVDDSKLLFSKFRKNDNQLLTLIEKSIPGYKSKIFNIEVNTKTYWIAGNFITDKSSAYLLTINNPDWIAPYLFIRNYVILLLPLAALIMLISIMWASNIVIQSYTFLRLLFAELSEIIDFAHNKIKKQILFKLQHSFDRFSVVPGLKLFKNNQEIKELSYKVLSKAQKYKVTRPIARYLAKNVVSKLHFPPAPKPSYQVLTKKTTLYFSNIKNFYKVVERYNSVRAFRILTMLVKVQQEILPKYNGRIIKLYDDRLVAVFESKKPAEDAIRAAFEVQNTIKKLTNSNPENIELSIAIASGEVVEGNVLDKMLYIGLATKIGDSLCNKTPPGSIYIDQTTYELIGIESLSASEDAMAVKGLKEHIPFYKFDAEAVKTIEPNTLFENTMINV